jgi:hypothetical protein
MMKPILGVLIVAVALVPATTRAQATGGDPFHSIGFVIALRGVSDTPVIDGERALLGGRAVPTPVPLTAEATFASCPVDGERALLNRCSRP